MIVELRFFDRNRKPEFREISRTELTAPNVLQDKQGNFFLKCPVDPRIAAGTKDVPLPYLQCRGEHISNIEVVRKKVSEQEEVWHDF